MGDKVSGEYHRVDETVKPFPYPQPLSYYDNLADKYDVSEDPGLAKDEKKEWLAANDGRPWYRNKKKNMVIMFQRALDANEWIPTKLKDEWILVPANHSTGGWTHHIYSSDRFPPAVSKPLDFRRL